MRMRWELGEDSGDLMSNDLERLNVLVVGAGIIGLTTALRLQETGRCNVSILAETFPTDPRTIRYTSHWAGAYYVSYAGDDDQRQKIDKDTFDTLWAHSAPGHPASHCFNRNTATVYEETETTHVKWFEYMPEFRYLSSDELIPGATLGYTFRTVTITPSLYLSYLLSCFSAHGGTVIRASLQHISQVLEDGTTPFGHVLNSEHRQTHVASHKLDALFVCTGLGSRSLGGVEDDRVFPVRGQTVLLHAPWVRFSKSYEKKDGTYTYALSRKNGDVLVGGTRTSNDWSATPREDTTTDILRRVFALVPELAPPTVSNPTVDDVRALIVDVGCGLRPARKGGIRLEVEWTSPDKRGKRIPVVFNYGHAGQGYISSWGSASFAVGLLDKALKDGCET